MTDMLVRLYALPPQTNVSGVGPVAFYERAVDATVIEDSTPGVYRGLLRK